MNYRRTKNLRAVQRLLAIVGRTNDPPEVMIGRHALFGSFTLHRPDSRAPNQKGCTCMRFPTKGEVPVLISLSCRSLLLLLFTVPLNSMPSGLRLSCRLVLL